MTGFDEIRRKAALDGAIEILIDTSLVPDRPKVILLKSYYEFSGVIDWGDGTFGMGTYGSNSHTYDVDGIYLIKNYTISNYFRFQTQGNVDAPKFLKIDYKNNQLDGTFAFQGAVNLTEVKINSVRRQNIMFQNMFNNTPNLNQDVSDYVTWMPSDSVVSLWLNGKSYLNYNYQWIDNIIIKCYERELAGGWDGLIKWFGLGNCRRSTASDVAFNYLKFTRGWSFTINATVIT